MIQVYKIKSKHILWRSETYFYVLGRCLNKIVCSRAHWHCSQGDSSSYLWIFHKILWSHPQNACGMLICGQRLLLSFWGFLHLSKAETAPFPSLLYFTFHLLFYLHTILGEFLSLTVWLTDSLFSWFNVLLKP